MQHLVTAEELAAWEYDYVVNGNLAADLMAYWTEEVSTIVANAIFCKLPITVDYIRKILKVVSPYSRGYPSQPWLHPDESTGTSYLYQVIDSL